MSARIAVLSATGTQGTSVLKALAQSSLASQFKVSAFTRNPDSERVKSTLANYQKTLNVQPVKADIADISTIKQAFKDADIVFANSNSFDDMAGEVSKMRAVIDEAKAANIKLFIWSTLPSIKELSNGKYVHAQHFENKALIQDYLAQSGLKWASFTLGPYLENLTNYHSLQPNEHGGYTLKLITLKPDVKVGWTWVERDLGPMATKLIEAHVEKSRDEMFGRVYTAASTFSSLQDIAQIVERVLGKKVDIDVMPEAPNEDLGDMFAHYNEFSLYKGEPLPPKEFVNLGVQFGTLDEFVKEKLIPTVQ